MPLISLILILAVVGFLTYLLITYVPMPPAFRTAIIVIVVIALILYLVQLFGLTQIPVPRVR